MKRHYLKENQELRIRRGDIPHFNNIRSLTNLLQLRNLQPREQFPLFLGHAGFLFP
jgi:hypothetical protein